MQAKLILFTLLGLVLSQNNFAQKTTIFTENNLHFKKGVELYDQGIFGQAQREFKIAIDEQKPLNVEPSRLFNLKSRLLYAKAAIMNDDPEGEKLIQEFTRTYQPDPMATEAIIEIADYYFNKKDYDNAIEFYKMVDATSLSKEERGSLRFKMGYSYFVKQDFRKARSIFAPMKDEKTDYFYPINYYYGLTAFYEKDYNEAINSFKKLEQSKKYQKYIPYYICQIYFAQKKYDELISYGVAKYNSSEINDKKEMGLLIGQAYYEKKMYADALPYLEAYAQSSPKMREEDFYQLAHTQYQTSHYDKASENFEQLKNVESALGQNALYCLGDCYIHLNNKQSAKSAFQKASELKYDKDIQEEALYNYAKLSFELNNDREAIQALEKFTTSSKFYNDAQNLMGDLFMQTRDYENALRLMDGMTNKTPRIQEAYQKVALQRGMQLINLGDNIKAIEYFDKSLKYPIDPSIKSQAYYWKADIAHQQKQYGESLILLDKYSTSVRNADKLPEESSIAMASYMNGYNYFKQKKYSTASTHFEDAVNKIKRSDWSNESIKINVMADATLRAGDCQLSKNNYNSALKYYNEAIEKKYPGYVYALFESAIIKGLKGQKVEKIVDLETLVEEYPNSEYTDEALLELGSTYQDMNEYQKAKGPLTKLVKGFKSKSDLVNKALLRLGLISYNQGDTKSAIEYYKQVLDNNPTKKESSDALASLEEIYVKDLGQPDEYFALKEKIGYNVSDLTKDSLNFQVAETQYENGNYEKAALGYTNYLSKFPNGINSLLSYFHRGDSYFQLKQFEKSYPDLEFVINKKNSPYIEKSLGKLGYISFYINKDYPNAAKFFTQLEEIATSDNVKFEAQIGAMQSAYKNGDQELVKIYASKVSKNPKANKSQLANANFYLGKIAFDNENFDDAIKYLEKVSKDLENEQAAEARYYTAESYFNKHNLVKAEDICIRANKESAGFDYWIAKSVILLSDINVEKGDLLNARAALEAVIENYASNKEIVNIAQTKLNILEKKEQVKSRLQNDKKNDLMEMQDK